MTSAYVDRASRVAKLTAALRRHITAPGSLECGRKRQAAYIIEDIDPADCIDLDQEAFRIEGVRRSLCELNKRLPHIHSDIVEQLADI